MPSATGPDRKVTTNYGWLLRPGVGAAAGPQGLPGTVLAVLGVTVVLVGELYPSRKFLMWTEWPRLIRHGRDIRPAIRVLHSQPG